ncbi:hypothetical protein SCLCIDRAFT_23971 [Scleroderma citrinum Foug A]|uniref:Uncharacterized protein n=1 Tax=Scleroderma citrinum Foug A TaxID=1036808 RepID=A0A0C3AFU1_9AGAM|nr:hypothetical protein SCLCIDRAFT_23971 [Scleroderma citrinum Foug A]
MSIPTNSRLSDQVSAYMRSRFSFLAFPGSATGTPPIPLDLPVDLSIGMHQMVFTLVAAYNNPVQSSVDLVRLAESLAPMEPGNNGEREDMFIRKFSPTMCGLLDEPAVILGEGGIVALWYLPGALARPTQKNIMQALCPLYGRLTASIWATHGATTHSILTSN